MEQTTKRQKMDTNSNLGRYFKESFLEDPWVVQQERSNHSQRTVFFKESFLEDPWAVTTSDNYSHQNHQSFASKPKNFKPPCKHRKNCKNQSSQHRNQFYHPR